jgi:hypothetical protein
MQIILHEDDISKALTGFLVSMGINLEGKSVTTAFTAGRGVNGNTATLTIEESDEKEETLPGPQTYHENNTETNDTVVKTEEQSSVDLPDDTLVFE